MEMGYRAVPNGSDLPHFVVNPWNALYPELAEINLLPVRVDYFLEGIRRLKEQLSDFERHKIDLSEEDEGELELSKYFRSDQEDAMAGCDTVFDYPKDIAPVLADLWKDPGAGPHLQKILAEAGGCDVAVPIGGATLTPAFLKELRKWSGAELAEMPKKDRMTAVADGAVWTYDARMERMLPVPLTLSIQIGRDTRQKTVLNAHQPLAALSTFSQRCDLGGETLRLSLTAGKPGQDAQTFEIARAEIRAPLDGQMRVLTSVSEGRVFRLTVAPSDGTAQTLWEVTL